jgi:hypothetical protein
MAAAAAIRTAREATSSSAQLMLLGGQGEVIDGLLAKHPNSPTTLLETLSRSSERTANLSIATQTLPSRIQSCPTLSTSFSCFASTKEPLVTSGSRP